MISDIALEIMHRFTEIAISIQYLNEGRQLTMAAVSSLVVLVVVVVVSVSKLSLSMSPPATMVVC